MNEIIKMNYFSDDCFILKGNILLSNICFSTSIGVFYRLFRNYHPRAGYLITINKLGSKKRFGFIKVNNPDIVQLKYSGLRIDGRNIVVRNILNNNNIINDTNDLTNHNKNDIKRKLKIDWDINIERRKCFKYNIWRFIDDPMVNIDLENIDIDKLITGRDKNNIIKEGFIKIWKKNKGYIKKKVIIEDDLKAWINKSLACIFYNIFGSYYRVNERKDTQMELFNILINDIMNMGIKIEKKKKTVKYMRYINKYIQLQDKGIFKDEYKAIIRANKHICIWDIKDILEGLQIERVMRKGINKLEIWTNDIDQLIYKWYLMKNIINEELCIYKKINRNIILRDKSKYRNKSYQLGIEYYNINGIKKRRDYADYMMNNLFLDIIMIQ